MCRTAGSVLPLSPSNAPPLSQSSRMSARETSHDALSTPDGPVLRASGGSVHTARAPPNPGTQGGLPTASTSGPRAAAPAPGLQSSSHRVSLRAAPNSAGVKPVGIDAPRAAAPMPPKQISDQTRRHAYVNADAVDNIIDSLDSELGPPVPARQESVKHHPTHRASATGPMVTRQASGKRSLSDTLGRQTSPPGAEDYMNVATDTVVVDQVSATVPAAERAGSIGGQYRNMGQTSAVSLCTRSAILVAFLQSWRGGLG